MDERELDVVYPCSGILLSLQEGNYDTARNMGEPGGQFVLIPDTRQTEGFFPRPYLVVENLPAKAGDKGSVPGLGGPHMLQSNWAHSLEPVLQNRRSLCSRE